MAERGGQKLTSDDSSLRKTYKDYQQDEVSAATQALRLPRQERKSYSP